MQSIVHTLDRTTFGENGAVAVKSLENNLLEIFSKQLTRGSVPNLKVTRKNSTIEDLVTAIKLTFYTRSIQNGAGERKVFYLMFLQLCNEMPHVMIDLIPYVVDPKTGGSWKDLCNITEMFSKEWKQTEPMTVFTQAVIKFFATQLVKDFDNLMIDPNCSVSLAAKYAPSEDKHYWNVIGKQIAELVWNLKHDKTAPKMTVVYSNYRKTLSTLRKRIDIVESKMCANTWSDINFNKVPGVAMQKLGRWAFPNIEVNTKLRRTDLIDRIICAENFSVYKNQVKSGKAVIHGSTVGLDGYGREFNKLVYSKDDQRAELLNLQFTDLIKCIQERLSDPSANIDLTGLIPLVDVSASMSVQIGKNVSAMDIAVQMGMIISELDPTSEFYQRMITFETNPHWIDTSTEKDFFSKYRKILFSPWAGSTNFEKAFELILDIAVAKKIPAEKMKKFKMIVFSDMQFNVASSSKWDTLHEKLTKLYSEAGYTPPGMIYWNLAARPTDGFVVDDSEKGVVMVSGYGTGQLKQILSGQLKQTDPLTKMHEVLGHHVFDDLDAMARKSLADHYFLV